MSSFDVTVRSAGLRRRRIVQRVLAIVATLCALAAVTMLGIVIGSVAVKGGSSLSLDFFTKPRGLYGVPGGIADAIVGSALIVGIATLIAVPIGVLVAIYLSEFASKGIATFVRVVLDVMNGIPAIVVGIFVFGVLVTGRGQSALAGSCALSILMVPMIARATQEVLALVPGGLREASLALGVSRWRTVLGVVLPTVTGGIVTGTVLAVARVAGETAPLLFTSSIAANAVNLDVSQALPTIPVAIFVYSESADPHEQALAWTSALVLISFVLVSSVMARALSARSRRKLTGGH
ncbi:MAG: phosphate transport system permease protein [Gaiellaceae bacterium]|nr:phosphate transport system permease protein [Gaiellaceae bacterium]